jgi:hypothetical protein
MLRFIADENFNNAIVRGVFRVSPVLDLCTVQDAGLAGTADIELLNWAATHRRVLLTHDVQTMRKYATNRVVSGLAMPGVIEVPTICVARRVIHDILLLNECCEDGELEGQIIRLPM